MCMEHLRYKLGFALYWLFFAVLAVFAARNPGFVGRPELVPYPWFDLVVTWDILAILVAIFYFILKPAFVRGSASRLWAAFALSLVMSIASILTMITDMPGLYYLPRYFSLLTFLILLVLSVFRTGRALWRKAAGQPLSKTRLRAFAVFAIGGLAAAANWAATHYGLY